MPELRSRTVTHGRNMAGARALMRASGVPGADIGRKPIIAVANSFTEFVPGHTHLQPVGRIVSEAITAMRRHRPRVQHDRRRRRHRDGPRRHALQPPVPRPDRGQRGVHGRGALRRRPDLHLQLRQDHARHADGRPAPQHPDGLRLRRSDGIRPRGPRRRHGPHARPGRRDVRRREPECLGRGHAPDRGERLSDLRVLFRHVHRQLDELPDRGDRPLPPRQRLAPRDPHRPQGAVRERGPHGRRHHPPVLRRGRRLRPAARGRDPRRLRERHGPRHRHGRLDQHDPAPARRRPGGRARLRPQRHGRGLAPGSLPGQGRPERRQGPHVLHGGRAPRGRHPRHPRRAVPRLPTRTSTCPLPLHQGVAGRLGRARRLPDGRGRRAVPRGPRLRPLGDRLLAVRALGGARRGRGRMAASATRPTRTRRTAASRSCAATWPWTAAS